MKGQYSPRASFVLIMREVNGEIEVCVNRDVNPSGEIQSSYKLVGGTAEPVEGGTYDLYETHYDTASREVAEETGGENGFGGITIEKMIPVFDSEPQVNDDDSIHTRRFYLARRWSGGISTPLESEDSPALWVPLWALKRNLLPSHYEGMYAALDVLCLKSTQFLELLRRQKGFEDYVPTPHNP